jgi:hypothetical protein
LILSDPKLSKKKKIRDNRTPQAARWWRRAPAVALAYKSVDKDTGLLYIRSGWTLSCAAPLAQTREDA